MKKTSKILSLLVAFCMAFTLLTGVTALAEDLTVAAYEADTDFIIVDFAEAVNLTAANVILRKGGVDVPFTVASADHSKITDDLRDNYSYKIVPEGGVIPGEEYKITLLNVANADGTKTLASWAKTFTVTVVNQGLALDDANAKNSFGTTSNMYKAAATNPNGDTSKIEATVDGSTSYAIQLARAIGDDVKEGALANANFAPTENKEITVKVKMGVVGPSVGAGSQWNFSLGLINNPAAPNYTYSSLHGNFFNLYYNPKYNTSRVEIYSGDGTASSTSVLKKIYDGRSNLPNYGDMETADGVEVKLSIRDGLFNAYVGGEKVANYNIADSIADTAFALIRINASAKANATGATIYLKDFLATRCIEIIKPEMEKATDVEVNDSIKVIFPAEMASSCVTTDNIKLKDSENNIVEGYSVSAEGKIVTIKFDKELEYRSDYKVTFENMTYKKGLPVIVEDVAFKTTIPAFEVASFDILDGEGKPASFSGTVNVSATIKNNKIEPSKSFVATIAIYNSSNQMVKMVGKVHTLATNDEALPLAINGFVCEAGETYTAKCFVWDSFTSMTKVTEISK